MKVLLAVMMAAAIASVLLLIIAFKFGPDYRLNRLHCESIGGRIVMFRGGDVACLDQNIFLK